MDRAVVVRTRPAIQPVVRIPGLWALLFYILFGVVIIAAWVIWMFICAIVWLLAIAHLAWWHRRELKDPGAHRREPGTGQYVWREGR